MTREQYLAKRTELVNAAQTALNNNDIDKFNELKGKIEKLDNDFAAFAQAQANLNAINGENERLRNSAINEFTENGDAGQAMNGSRRGTEENYTASSEVYERAWLRNLREEQLTDEEARAFQMVNEGTHSTETNPAVIPTTLADKILRRAEELYPIWGDTVKYHVKGTFSIILDTETGEADWYKESEESELEVINTDNVLKLSGNELAKYCAITWKSKAMSLDDFRNYLIEKLGLKMGRSLARSVAHGAGATEGSAGQPMGIVTYLNKSATEQITEYTENKLSYKDITSARSKVAAGYSAGLVIYANSNTIWNEIANVMDTNNRPIFLSDAIDNGGVGRILGITVKEDASFDDGEILFANMPQGYINNIEEDLSIKAEEKIVGRKIIYGAYMIVDGNVTFAKAFSLLKKTA